MCNTREENAAELARGAEKPVVRTTRADLIDKLVDIRLDDFDSHDLDDAVRNGRYGYAELPNAELEDLADEWGLEEDGVEVRYTITDADTSKPSPEAINAEMLEALKAALTVIEQDMPRTERNQKREQVIAAIAKAEGR